MNNGSRTSIRAANQPEYTTRYYMKKTYMTLGRGVLSINHSKLKQLLSVLVVIMITMIICNKDDIFAEFSSGELRMIFGVVTVMMILFLAVFLFGQSVCGAGTESMFFKIGLVNSLQEPPFLYLYKKDNVRRLETFIYSVNGIPLEKWQEKTAAIETVIKRDIVSIENYKDKTHVAVQTVPKGTVLPTDLKWKDSLTPTTDFELLIGIGFAGQVKVDLNQIPHMLIGGATGSGKTILLKTLLRQCVIKDAHVVLADFKGGLDYSRFQDTITIITERKIFAEHLKAVITIMNQRKQKLAEMGCANIIDYNSKFGQEYNHIVLAVDELAEVTDKTGETKAGKEEIDTIIGCLSTIARLGRAYGIHLLLGMQRADATVVPGQIRNNVGYRACGFAPDKVLADITLDNPEAVDKLRTNVTGKMPGRFVDNRSILFQGYCL